MRKVAVVGIRKLGRVVAMHYAMQGDRVVLVARTPSDLQALAEEIRAAGGDVTTIRADLTDPSSLEALAAEDVDVCVAAQAAGGRFGSKPLLDIDDEELARGLAVYVQGAWNLLKTVGARMVARGHGTFVQVGTSSGVRTREGFAALGASQHALRALVQVAAREFRLRGVHVAYLPVDGPIASDATRAWAKSNGREGGLISPHEIARAIDFLASQEKSAWTHELLVRAAEGDWTAPT